MTARTQSTVTPPVQSTRSKLALALLLIAPAIAPATAAGEGDRIADTLNDRADVQHARSSTGSVTAFWITSDTSAPLEKGTYVFHIDGRKAHLTIILPVVGKFVWATDGSTTWGIDPLAGPIIHEGDRARGVQRMLAALAGGASWKLYYESAEPKPRPAVGLDPASAARRSVGLTPSLGDGDSQHIHIESGLLAEAVVHAPASDGGVSAVHISLDDWKADKDRLHPARMQMDREHYRFVMDEETISFGSAAPSTFELEDTLRMTAEKNAELAQAEGEPSRVTVTHLNEVHVASIRRKVKLAEISRMFAVFLPEVMTYVRGEGIEATGAPFARYHNFGPTEVDVEVGFPVATPVEGNDRIKASTLPGGRALSTWHVGPYHKLGDTHNRVEKFLGKESLKARAPSWEIYWTDPGLVPDPKRWRTQVVCPIK